MLSLHSRSGGYPAKSTGRTHGGEITHGKVGESRQRHSKKRTLVLIFPLILVLVGFIRGNKKISNFVFAFDDNADADRPKDTVSNGTPANNLEQHYRSVYESMIISKDTAEKWLLFSLKTHGIGNKVRALSGAMFLAAITDRVLLVDSEDISLLFEPPIIGGLKLDWNASLARGACDGGALIPADPAIRVYPAQLIDFDHRYRDEKCIIVNATFGHDRQIISLNEDTYKNKVLQLFGNTSRFNWSRDSLGLVLQRPSEAFLAAGLSAMTQLKLDLVPPSHRIAVHVRTFFNDVEQFYNDLRTQGDKILNCVEILVRSHVDDIIFSDKSNKSITILFETDSPQLIGEAKERLEKIDRVRSVIDPGRPFLHTELSQGRIEPFIDWFLLSETSHIIATGWSSFGMTAFFRPSIFPKTLSTIDNVFKFKR
mmetsp:Transcript_47774/g.144467  ORF Transcript_47774/g.144467 Transcript_47774/m.144467 type:complete len:426 (-) Transcript_47774:981-2258(-)